jgi:hypothetical protein
MGAVARRIGLFFFILGGFVIALFLTSDAAGDTNFWLLLWGVPLLLLGLWILRRSQPQSQPSQRFRLLRWLFGGRNKNNKDDRTGSG